MSPVTLGSTRARPEDFLWIDDRLLLLVSRSRQRLVPNSTTVGRGDDVGRADPSNEAGERGDAAQPVVPAINGIEPVVAIDAEPKEELQDGEAGAGGLGGGDELDEDAEDADGERAVAVRERVWREGELGEYVHQGDDGAQRCRHPRRLRGGG